MTISYTINERYFQIMDLSSGRALIIISIVYVHAYIKSIY